MTPVEKHAVISRSGTLLTYGLTRQDGFPSTQHARQLVYYLSNLRYELCGGRSRLRSLVIIYAILASAAYERLRGSRCRLHSTEVSRA